MVIDKIIVKCRYISYENRGHKCVEVYNQAAHHFLRYVDKNTMQFYLLSKDAGLRSTQLNNEIK